MSPLFTLRSKPQDVDVRHLAPMRRLIGALATLALVACSAGPGAAESRAKADAGSQCAGLGTWQGTYTCGPLGGWPVSWEFNDDGGAVLSQGWPPEARISMQWAIAGQELTFTELNDAGCTNTATYHVSFDGGCGGIIGFVRQSDTCTVRAKCIDGLTLNRP